MPALAVAVAYVGGSVSFPWLIARFYGVDLRATGSRKLGGSNLAKTVGLAAGVAGGVLDASKGLAAVLLARGFGLPLDVQLACGVAAVVGQMWPLFHGFDGGRANATGFGFAVAADPLAALTMLVPLYVAAPLRRLVRPHPTRLVPLASLLSFALFPALVWEERGLTATTVAGIAVLVLIVVRRVSAGLRADLATGAPILRIVANRILYDRSELQQRGVVEI